RVLHALAQNRPVVSDPTQGGGTGEARAAIAIQQARQRRLRTFFAEQCHLPSGPDRLPASEPHMTNRLYGGRVIEDFLQPWNTKRIEDFEVAWKLLLGRWEGWQTLYGGKPTRLDIHVVSLGNAVPLQGTENAPFVKACSDQGMVIGHLANGYVELPRSDSFGNAYSIRLWESGPPRSRDLEGVVLLEVRPGEAIVAGIAWLSRAVKFDWTAPPSSYFCQDRDLEEQRKNVEREQHQRGNPLLWMPLF